MANDAGGDALTLIAQALDTTLNGPAPMPQTIGFVLLTYPFGSPGRTVISYVSNSDRDTVKLALRQLLARWDGQPEVVGHG